VARTAESAADAAQLPVHQCVHPFMAIAYPLSHTLIRRIAAKLSDKVATMALESYPAPPHRPLSAYALRGGRLRVGYVSPDFGDHPVGKDLQFAVGIHNRSRFEARRVRGTWAVRGG
jgi:predicted O-linked N-acetylglucosamine transferase (SPINDLY family)